VTSGPLWKARHHAATLVRAVAEATLSRSNALAAPTPVHHAPLRRPGPWVLANAVLCLPLLGLACGDDGGSTDDDPAVDGSAPTTDLGPGPSDAGRRVDGSPSGPDLGPPDPEGVPVFLAQGHMGRTTISCDDGRSWTHDSSLDGSVRCFEDGFDCDHHPGAAKGLTWSPKNGGRFFATFGWGPPGGIERSVDGATWTPILEETTFGGLSYGNDVLVAGARNAQVSTDEGETFGERVATGLEVSNVRRGGFAGGRHVIVGSGSGDNDIVWSIDGGTWERPSTLPAGCGASIQNAGGIVDVGGTIVVIGGDGVACASSDGGDTFVESSIGGDGASHAVATGTEVFVWTRGTVHRSSNGTDWSSEPTTPEDLRLGPVAVSDDGTFVAVRGGWRTWYEDQEFYRSEDGVTWETLPDGAFTGSHPIRDIHFGRLASCP